MHKRSGTPDWPDVIGQPDRLSATEASGCWTVLLER
jgi:hypothetical protein